MPLLIPGEASAASATRASKAQQGPSTSATKFTPPENKDRSTQPSHKKQKVVDASNVQRSKHQQETAHQFKEGAAKLPRPSSETVMSSSNAMPGPADHGAQHTQPPASRKRKKLRKQAQKKVELILSSAQDAQFTGSVLVDKPVMDTRKELANNSNEESIPRSESTEKSKGSNQIQATTTSILPKPVQLQKMRMFNLDKPIQIYTQPLLILDLNGILCHRIRHRKEPPGKISYRPAAPNMIAATKVIPRPDLSAFLTYLDAHFCLAVWTSATPKTAKKLIELLIPDRISKKLLFRWGQTRCKAVKTMDNQKEGEEVFLKELDKVWTEYPLFHSSNTLLLDDSPEKCKAFRCNALHPKPLHGQSQAPSSAANWVSDQDNHAVQLDFFRKLVEFWETNDITASWDELGQVQYSNNNSQSEDIWSFLQENATEHMGWNKE